MKTIFLTFLTIFFAGVFSAEAQTAQTLKLRVNGQKTVTADKLKIKFVSLVEDSRCPEDVDCVWAGNARIKIKVTDQRGRTETFEINTNMGAKGASFGGYAINLETLTPTPKADAKLNQNAYTATFNISRLTR